MSDIVKEAQASVALDGETQVVGESQESPGFRFATKKFVLQALLEKASTALPTRDILPVLKDFLLEVSPDRVRAIATDLELAVISTTEVVTVEQTGSAVLPGARLLEIVREAEDGQLEMTVGLDDEGTLNAHIAVARTTWDLKLKDGSEYPLLPEVGELEWHTLDRSKFLDMLNRVMLAAATDTVRPSLMMIDVSQGRARAADGIRFQQVTMAWWPEGFDVQIPIFATENLVKLLRMTEAPSLDMADTEDYLVFRIASDVYVANKLNAQFPEVDEILLKPAKANDQELRVDREEFAKAIKRVRVTADPETSAVVLRLSENQLELRSKDKFGNMASEELDVAWSAPEREVAFNHEHLTDMLTMADAKSCLFLLGPDKKTRKSPIMLRDDEAGMVGILNQLRIDFLE